jgi:uncharacterized membrane protein YiaA
MAEVSAYIGVMVIGMLLLIFPILMWQRRLRGIPAQDAYDDAASSLFWTGMGLLFILSGVLGVQMWSYGKPFQPAAIFDLFIGGLFLAFLTALEVRRRRRKRGG